MVRLRGSSGPGQLQATKDNNDHGDSEDNEKGRPSFLSSLWPSSLFHIGRKAAPSSLRCNGIACNKKKISHASVCSLSWTIFLLFLLYAGNGTTYLGRRFRINKQIAAVNTMPWTSCPASLRLSTRIDMEYEKEFISLVFDALEQVQKLQDPLQHVVSHFVAEYVEKRGALSNHAFWAEFGVYQGKSLLYSYQRLRETTNLTWIGFDSFVGLPERWQGYTFNNNNYSQVRALLPSAIRLYRGWFQDSIGHFLKEHSSPVAGGKDRMMPPASLINFDADLFVSTAIVFQLLGASSQHAQNNIIVPGTILCFDELFGYFKYEQHELLALFLWMKQVNATLCPLAVLAPFDRNAANIRNAGVKALPAPHQGACFQVLSLNE